MQQLATSQRANFQEYERAWPGTLLSIPNQSVRPSQPQPPYPIHIHQARIFLFLNHGVWRGEVTEQLKNMPTAQTPLVLLQPVLPFMDPLQQSSQPRLPQSPCCYLMPVSLLWEIQIIKNLQIMLSASLCSLSLQIKQKPVHAHQMGHL